MCSNNRSNMILVNPRPMITYEDTEHACLACGLFRPTLIFFCLLGQSVLADDELHMHYSDARPSQQACMAHASLISILIATVYIDLASAIH